MPATNDNWGDPLSLSLRQRIDNVCQRFEDNWIAGQSPRLEDFLGETAGVEREEQQGKRRRNNEQAPS